MLHPRTGNKAVVCALSASYISTFSGYPVRLDRTFLEDSDVSHGFVVSQSDSLKSRLQTTKTPISVGLPCSFTPTKGLWGLFRYV
jgi:hypothetical protein